RITLAIPTSRFHDGTRREPNTHVGSERNRRSPPTPAHSVASRVLLAGVRIVGVSESSRETGISDGITAIDVLDIPVRHVGIRILLCRPVIQPARHFVGKRG